MTRGLIGLFIVLAPWAAMTPSGAAQVGGGSALAENPRSPTGASLKAPEPPPAPLITTRAGLDVWVYEREPFKVQFDHDGEGAGGFFVDVDGMTVAELLPDALLQRTGTLAIPQGLDVGVHTVRVYTHDGTGVITASSEELRIDVRPRRPDRAAARVRVVRGGEQ